MTENTDKDLAKQEVDDSDDSSELSERTVIACGFSGPLPPPQVLAQYDEIQAGFADRIVAMAENQALHRQQSEKLAIEAEINDDRRQRRETFIGQILGFILALAIILIAATSIYLNPTWPVGAFSTLIGGGGIYGIIYAFRYTRQVESVDKTKPKAQ